MSSVPNHLAASVGGGLASAVGGLVAQSSNPSAANFGLAAAITGVVSAVLGGLYPWFKVWVEAKRQADRIAELEARLGAESKANAEKRHALRNHFEGVVKTLQVALEGEEKRAVGFQVELAHLKGQLGVVDHAHSEAINSASAAIQQVAKEQDPPVRVRTPHVEPSTPAPDDDSYLGPSPLLPRH